VSSIKDVTREEAENIVRNPGGPTKDDSRVEDVRMKDIEDVRMEDIHHEEVVTASQAV